MNENVVWNSLMNDAGVILNEVKRNVGLTYLLSLKYSLRNNSKI